MVIFLLMVIVMPTETANPELTVDPLCFTVGQTVVLKCRTDDLLLTIEFRKNNIGQGSCTPPFPCGSGIDGYQNPQQSGVFTTMEITEYNATRDDGPWICSYNNNPSPTLQLLEGQCSRSSQSGSGLKWWEWFLIIIGSVCGIIMILYVNYGCSNKNCKTHAKCWKFSGICHTDYPLVTGNSLEEWNIEHFCCLNSCCLIKVCNKKCCSCFLCHGWCMIEFPAKRVNENSQPLTRPPQSSSIDEQENNTKRKKKKKKAKHSVKENNDEPNPPDENSADDQQRKNTTHAKKENAVHTASGNNTKSDPNPTGERIISLDSLNSKSNKIHPEED